MSDRECFKKEEKKGNIKKKFHSRKCLAFEFLAFIQVTSFEDRNPVPGMLELIVPILQPNSCHALFYNTS